MLIGWDSETELITHANPVPRLACSTFDTAAGPGIMHADDPEHTTTLREALENHDVIFSSPAFDLCVYGNRWDEMVPVVFEAVKRGNVHCVLLREKLRHIMLGDFQAINQNPNEGFSLAACARRRLNVHLTKDDWRLRYGELIPLPIEAWPRPAVEYAQNDATTNRLLYLEQETMRAAVQQAEDADVFEDEPRQVRSSFAMNLMGVHGIMVDPVAVRKLNATVTEMWEAAKVRLIAAGLVRKDGTRDTKAAKDVMLTACARLGIDPKETASGGISMDAEACERVCDPLLDDYKDFEGLLKLKSTFIVPLENAGEGPIRPWWNSLVATGRISCKNPNLTQLPRAPGVRECYVPRKGCKFIFADYDKSEIVSWAQILHALFGGSKIGDAINRGLDPHTMMAATFLSTSYEDAAARIAAGDKHAKEARQTSKPPNFMFMGGGGALRYMLTQRKDMERDAFAAAFPSPNPMDDAERHRAAWFQTWEPEMWFEHVSQQTRNGFGSLRSYKSHRLCSGLSYTEYANRLFQMLTADYSKDAHWRVTWRQFMEPQSALYGTRCVVFVHDEIGLEAPEAQAPAAARELEQVMTETAQEWCPNVRPSASARILDRWSK